MKVIIAGSRTIVYPQLVDLAVSESGFDVTEVVCGCAKGVDQMGGHCRLKESGLWVLANTCDGQEAEHGWACRHHAPAAHFPAEWRKYGRGAGFRRNAEMSNYGDALVALWDGQSKGTQHTINLMLAKGKPVYRLLVTSDHAPTGSHLTLNKHSPGFNAKPRFRH